MYLRVHFVRASRNLVSVKCNFALVPLYLSQANYLHEYRTPNMSNDPRTVLRSCLLLARTNSLSRKRYVRMDVFQLLRHT